VSLAPWRQKGLSFTHSLRAGRCLRRRWTLAHFLLMHKSCLVITALFPPLCYKLWWKFLTIKVTSQVHWWCTIFFIYVVVCELISIKGKVDFLPKIKTADRFTQNLSVYKAEFFLQLRSKKEVKKTSYIAATPTAYHHVRICDQKSSWLRSAAVEIEENHFVYIYYVCYNKA